jgi:hypothetical protein
MDFGPIFNNELWLKSKIEIETITFSSSSSVLHGFGSKDYFETTAIF